MTTRLDDLAFLLGRSQASEFVAIERRRRSSMTLAGDDVTALDAEERLLSATLFRDSDRGRGHCSFSLPASLSKQEAAARVEEALAWAGRSVGPAWTLPVPAAPARVQTADSGFHTPEKACRRLQKQVSRVIGPGSAAARVQATTAETRLVTSAGFRSSYRTTAYRVEAELRRPRGTTAIVATATRLRDLPLSRELELATESVAHTTASPPPAGSYDLLLKEHALYGLPDYGLWSALVAQAEGKSERLGLTRYRSGQSIYGDQTVVDGDRLDVGSDGALPYAPLSVPFSDDGAAIRRFPLVSAGRAADVGLDAREAALRDREPNGGVRNLVIGAGTLSGEDVQPSSERPLLEVAALSWQRSDPLSGRLSASIRYGTLRQGSTATAISGGFLVGNLFEWLSRARLSRSRTRYGRFFGPRFVRIRDVTVI